jgi:hypothetical protein
MAGVAYTLEAIIGSGSRSTVLSGGDVHVLVLGDLNEVGICKFWFYICREARDP